MTQEFLSKSYGESMGTLEEFTETLIGNFSDELEQGGFICQVIDSKVRLVEFAIDQIKTYELDPVLSADEVYLITQKVLRWQKPHLKSAIKKFMEVFESKDGNVIIQDITRFVVELAEEQSNTTFDLINVDKIAHNAIVSLTGEVNKLKSFAAVSAQYTSILAKLVFKFHENEIDDKDLLKKATDKLEETLTILSELKKDD